MEDWSLCLLARTITWILDEKLPAVKTVQTPVVLFIGPQSDLLQQTFGIVEAAAAGVGVEYTLSTG
jgi:hypothetical protein